MLYQVNIDREPLKFLKKLDKNEREIVFKKIEKLSKNPEMGKSLTGNMVGIHSLRIGKFRVLYRILNERLIVIVIDIGHRKNVYKK